MLSEMKNSVNRLISVVDAAEGELVNVSTSQ